MKRYLLLLALLFLLPCSVRAAALPQELQEFARAQDIDLDEDAPTDAAGFTEELISVFERLRPALGTSLRCGIKAAVMQVLIVLLASLFSGIHSGTAGEKILNAAPLAGVLAVASLAVTELDSLLNVSLALLNELQGFADALLPTLAASVAATGAVSSAAAQQALTAWVSSLFIHGLHDWMPPLIYCYALLCTAACALGDERLKCLTAGVKKVVRWCLVGIVSLFSAYLSLSQILAGSSDAVSIKLTKAALSGAVPVVGDIISDTAETVLAGAGMMKNAIGIFGLVTVISCCALPFFSLLLQYFAYRAAALVCAVAEGGKLTEYLDGLGDAFALMLGMVGSAALMLFVSIFAALAVMIP